MCYCPFCEKRRRDHERAYRMLPQSYPDELLYGKGPMMRALEARTRPYDIYAGVADGNGTIKIDFIRMEEKTMTTSTTPAPPVKETPAPIAVLLERHALAIRNRDDHRRIAGDNRARAEQYETLAQENDKHAKRHNKDVNAYVAALKKLGHKFEA